MPPRYYAVRETEDYSDVTLHADRSCPDGPARAAPASLDGSPCPECTDAEPEGESETRELVNADDKSDRLLIESGVCPWCDDYEGDYVGSHASSAHPEKWAEYSDG